MTNETQLPADVTEAIRANRKIDAIKLLREHRGLGLKEAKHAVDAYIRENPHLIPQQSSGGGLGRLVKIVLGVVIAYALYLQLV
jgi:hypothetical protein